MITSKLFLVVFAVLLLQCLSAQDAKCKVSPTPVFSAPGRRLSEEKCLKYNWAKKNIECTDGAGSTKFPYVGLLGYKTEDQTGWLFACSSALISPEFVLTGGHCVAASPRISGPEIVRFSNSETNAKLSAVDAKVVNVIVHPKYKAPKRKFDIGLVKIEKITFSKLISPACLWSQPSVEVGEYVAPGQVSEKGEPITEMTPRVLDERTCKAVASTLFNHNWMDIADHQICANETFTSDRNMGSGGRPMIKLMKLDSTEDQMPYVLGVSSLRTRSRTNIGVYTRVSSFLDWIETTVWKTS